MKEKYLVINAGSSSLKFSLYDMPEYKELVNGYIEKIGKTDSFYTLKYNGEKKEVKKTILNHTTAVKTMLFELIDKGFIKDVSEIGGVGHRVLHGGEFYSDSVLIDDNVMKNIESLLPYGPLHLPGEIDGINSMREVLGEAVPQVAVFDTAFHQTMPAKNFMYPIPYKLYEEDGIRKYGFHGTSHKYIMEKMQEKLNKEDVNVISCHIGSGASICAIKDGKSYDTSMGLTPLDGVIMGTRSGAIDPSIIEFIANNKNMSVEQVTKMLNSESGLLGLCGQNDFRDLNKLVDEGNERAILALEMFENSIVNYVVKYISELEGKVDAIVITAGIGENGPKFRESIINKLSWLGIKTNVEMNDNISRFKKYQEGKISSDDSKIAVYVIPTDEEYMILKDTYKISKEYKKGIQKKVKENNK